MFFWLLNIISYLEFIFLFICHPSIVSQQQPFLLDKLKVMPHACEYVISKNGKPFDVRTYRRLFKKLLKAADLPDMKFHCLRHTFATRALEVGMDYKTLSEILGHASVGITLDLYAHSLKEHKIKQMNKLDTIHA